MKKNHNNNSTAKDISELASKLTPSSQLFVLNTINTFLYAQTQNKK